MPLHVLCLAALLAFAARSANAQAFDATNLRQPADLAATWLVHAGDDLAYADTDFDDSGWTPFDATKSLKTIFPNSRPEIAWYRLHVKVSPTQRDMALTEINLAPAFEVYVNGERLMQNGRVAPCVRYTMDASLLRRIPDRQLATGSLVIAVRVHISRQDWDSTYMGYYATNLTLGQEHELWEHIWLQVLGANVLHWFLTLLDMGLGTVALALFLTQRRQREYLWLSLWLFSNVADLPLTLFELFHDVPSQWTFLSALSGISSYCFMVLTFFAFLHLRLSWWLRILLAVALFGVAVIWFNSVLPILPANILRLAQVPSTLLACGVIPILLVVHFRRGDREAGILLIPMTLWSLWNYGILLWYLLQAVPALGVAAKDLGKLLFTPNRAGPVDLSFQRLLGLPFILSMAIIITLRSARTSRQQAVLEGEIAAAQQVQQVIVPEQIESVPGFTIESVYCPAQQVGGDFFQILPDSRGGLLLVLGDVAGKGLPAAMLVSVLVGAIRTAASYSQSPSDVLCQLNERLLGRTHGGFSTALAAHITADGWVIIANAGHLSPYLDGKEIELPGALPLGIVGNAAYETTQFHLPHGSRLTFYSDGVVEAQNQKGELFGFDRAQGISTQPAAAIVEAAIQFGQSDDITVVAIARHFALASAA
ncbi:MAG: SpoIIE family protein phosphatase [Terracidiphilus sp.]